MNKKDYKGYELIKALHDGEIEQGKSIEVYEYCPFMKDKKVATIEFDDNRLNWITGEFDTSYLFSDTCYFRVLEDNTEEIEELYEFTDMDHYDKYAIEANRKTINKLIKAVNSIRKEKE